MKTIDAFKKLLFMKLCVIYLRYIIGFAFVFASVIKIRSMRFTSVPVTEPVGHFFDAMYQTGLYWNFLGWSQFIAGCLLMTQRFATLGALIFFPIILNVFMITHAIDFGMGTPIITTLMLIGTVFLLLWDYRKWMILFQRDHKIYLNLTEERADHFMNDPVWIITGCLFVIVTIVPWVTDFNNMDILIVSLLALGIGSFCLMLWKEIRRMKRT